MNLKKSVAEILTNGYLMMMALFFIVAVPAVRLEWTLSKLSWVWVLLIAILVLTFVMAWSVARKSKKNSDKNSGKNSTKRALVIVILLSVVISVGFTRPDAEDATLEIVNTAVTTDSMYQYNEYTGDLDEYAMEGHAFSPSEMLYASFVKLTGMESTIVLYYVMPIFLLGFFFAGIWRLGSVLFEDSRHIALFELFVIGIYWMTTLLEGQSVVTGIFLNSWNGLTWLSCFVMPVAFANCLDWMKQAATGRVEHKLNKLFMAVVLLLAGQLTNDKGGFYVALMLFLTTAVIIVRKGYDYGIKTGRFKKRV